MDNKLPNLSIPEKHEFSILFVFISINDVDGPGGIFSSSRIFSSIEVGHMRPEGGCGTREGTITFAGVFENIQHVGHHHPKPYFFHCGTSGMI